MSQHDFIIANQGMPSARADINAALQALASTNKGSTAPATPYAGELWLDDSGSPWALKLYDGTDWIGLGTVNPTTNLFQATNHARTDQTIGMTAAINEAGWVDLASASTCDVAAAASNNVRITGSTAITSLGGGASGVRRILRFAGALTLTYNASALILPGGANITTAANDTATFVSLGAGNWICADYKRASGLAVVGAAGLTLTAGAPLVLNPWALNTTTTQAHGLGVKPQLVAGELECITAELGYSVGDAIDFGTNWSTSAGDGGFVVLKDATNLSLITMNANNPRIPNKTTRSPATATPANWKMTVLPYKIA